MKTKLKIDDTISITRIYQIIYHCSLPFALNFAPYFQSSSGAGTPIINDRNPNKLLPHPYPSAAYMLGAKMGKANAVTLRRNWLAAEAEDVYFGNESKTYACIACVPRMIPAAKMPTPISVMTQYARFSPAQPYQNKPMGMSKLPGIIIGTRYSGAVSPPALLFRRAHTRSVTRAPPCAAIVLPIARAM